MSEKEGAREREAVLLIGLQGAGKTTFRKQRLDATHGWVVPRVRCIGRWKIGVPGATRVTRMVGPSK
ncbi:MAG: hypothetical protein AAF533_25580 [Acidobacteriota bacterium]